MVLFSGDQRELLLPLHAGAREEPAFASFLARLRARTGAQRTLLFAGLPGDAAPAIAGQAVARGVAPLAVAQLAEALPLPVNALRPDRVYALSELPLDGDPERTARRTALGIGHARVVRVAPREDFNGWLLLLHASVEFAAADSALLSALAPHLAAALETRSQLASFQLRAHMAEDGLARLGIAQAALGADGRAIIADPAVRLPRAPLAGAVASGEPCVIGTDEDALLLRPFVHPGTLPAPAVAIATRRAPQRENRQAAAAVLAKLHGLSPREAALADALSRGEPLVEAGVALGLTPETTRNYSKRIYAKTGATGQADLVRTVLTGLAALA